ncbi:MAG: sulfite exporter TauE/SafE family protein [Bacteroides sp.]|nr:sulfite exporter TauE/SafE family protein [Bacteroides sp.]
MTIESIILLVLFVFGASFVQRTIGFGFGIFIMTMLPYLMPSYGEATMLSGLLAMVTSLIICIKLWKYIPWRKMVGMLVIFIVTSYVAIQFVSGLNNALLQRILGVMLILSALYFIFFSHRVRIRPSLSTQLSLGTLSGVMGGFFGMQGPPAVIYFLAVTDSKNAYTAMAQTYFLLGNILMTLFRAQTGCFTTEVAHSWCIGLPAVLLGTWVGGMVYEKIPMNLLRKMVYLYIALSGLIALL